MDLSSFLVDDPCAFFSSLACFTDVDDLNLQGNSLIHTEVPIPTPECSASGLCMSYLKRGSSCTSKDERNGIFNAVSQTLRLAHDRACFSSSSYTSHCACQVRKAIEVLLNHISESSSTMKCSHEVPDTRGCTQLGSTTPAVEAEAEPTQLSNDIVADGHSKMRSSDGLQSLLELCNGQHLHAKEVERPVTPTISDIESALNRMTNVLPETKTTDANDPKSFDPLSPDSNQPNHPVDRSTDGIVSVHQTFWQQGSLNPWRPLKSVSSDVMEPKYKVVLKCDKPYVVSSDGYKWRKYGRKSIKGSPYCRSYYKCRHVNCEAKKQVEMCGADMVQITYDGLHLHYSS
ncbi:hypothetical protein KP509_33G064700 [Ceratopteris richardii]|uniref:WRKY domain-containing protein n=1 Tax=Ceratopteris richardii TaxID=49495 RepID=A0A8T2QRL8_CERRI|nr:hypothetical protein KP509_33G064700 [Ceratopteris richardii]